MAFLWSLWPLNLNRWLFQLKLLHMIYISWKNYKILKFWVLDFGFGLQNFFWPLKVFLRSLVSNKSSGMQKLYVWAIFHAKQFLLPIFHSGSLWTLWSTCNFMEFSIHFSRGPCLEQRLVRKKNHSGWRQQNPKQPWHCGQQ